MIKIDQWTRLANEKIKKLEKSLTRSYGDELSNKYEFKVNHIEPFAYGTFPLSGDYKLFVDIRITNKSKNDEILENICLGSYYEKNERDKIPWGHNFGEQYFKDTYNELIRIVLDSYKESFKKKV